MKKRICLIIASILILAMLIPTSFAATDNSIDRIPHVGDNYEFNESSFVRLRIQENTAGDFSSGPQTFRLLLNNAEWYADSHPLNVSQVKNHTDTSDGDAIVSDIKRLSSTIIQVTLDSGGITHEKVWWSIPLYTKVTNPGYVTVTIDSWDSLVTSGTYPYGYAVGTSTDREIQVDITQWDNKVSKGFEFDIENPIQLTIQEKTANAFGANTQSFQLKLENGMWYSNNMSKLNVSAMKNSAKIKGGDNASVKDIIRLDDKTIEIKIEPGGYSNDRIVINIPLYFKVIEAGEVAINVKLSGSPTKEQKYVIVEAEDNKEFVEVKFTIGQKSYGIGERTMTMDVAPYIKSIGNGLGRTMMPVSFVSAALQSDSIEWNPMERSVRITKGEATVILFIGSPALNINGVISMMDVPAEISNGRTMIPVAHIAKAFHIEYIWDEELKTVTFLMD